MRSSKTNLLTPYWQNLKIFANLFLNLSLNLIFQYLSQFEQLDINNLVFTFSNSRKHLQSQKLNLHTSHVSS